MSGILEGHRRQPAKPKPAVLVLLAFGPDRADEELWNLGPVCVTMTLPLTVTALKNHKDYSMSTAVVRRKICVRCKAAFVEHEKTGLCDPCYMVWLLEDHA